MSYKSSYFLLDDKINNDILFQELKRYNISHLIDDKDAMKAFSLLYSYLQERDLSLSNALSIIKAISSRDNIDKYATELQCDKYLIIYLNYKMNISKS